MLSYAIVYQHGRISFNWCSQTVPLRLVWALEGIFSHKKIFDGGVDRLSFAMFSFSCLFACCFVVANAAEPNVRDDLSDFQLLEAPDRAFLLSLSYSRELVTVDGASFPELT